MPRTLRHQYAGAVYHVMARGDGGKPIFETDDDGKAFLFRLGQVCASHGWRVHAWVLMNNHFHLLLETPEPNLVTGMKYLLGTFSQGWNARRSRRGHVFQGRYKAVPVSATVESPYLSSDNCKSPRRQLKLPIQRWLTSAVFRDDRALTAAGLVEGVTESGVAGRGNDRNQPGCGRPPRGAATRRAESLLFPLPFSPVGSPRRTPR